MKHTSETPAERAASVERPRHVAPIPLSDVLLMLGIVGILVLGAVLA